HLPPTSTLHTPELALFPYTTLFRSTGAQGNLGSLTLQTNGSYTYTVADSAVQFLGPNDTKVDTFTVTAFDGTTKQISFTIHGTDKAPKSTRPTPHTDP